ncbi:hypothetical protein [Lysobacter solisilvae (ex Woo and Kim 2020)]|uniref:Secreted protein n=1 Tax=Agrilutibacter terrestris TaxID=2865112 RepID=A0A7H0FZM4_9GAMM|nr:hypothetical protein [Lysobacter terrestris]QNP41490.1 hypothetical protein H8B22_04525 [Lysobacter terrestris]
MRRIAVCLLILASTSVAARESKLSDADGGSCPSTRAQSTATRAPDRDPASMALPVKKTKPSAAPNAGGGDDVRLPSPRWHRFLPGMFR